MKLQDDIREETFDEQGVSFRARFQESHRSRSKQLRTKMILINSAIALIIIMIVLAGEVITLNQSVTKQLDREAGEEAKVRRRRGRTAGFAQIWTRISRWLP